MRASPTIRAAFLSNVALLVAGCGFLPPNDPEPAVDDPAAGLTTDCEPPFVFEGESTLADIGLGDIPGIGDAATRQGVIRITRNVISHEQFAPPEVPVVVAEGQHLCVTWPDGSGMSMLLAEPFGEEPGGGLPVAPIVVGVVLTFVGAISWMAFRREAPSSG